jgi:hypothetical protein
MKMIVQHRGEIFRDPRHPPRADRFHPRSGPAFGSAMLKRLPCCSDGTVLRAVSTAPAAVENVGPCAQSVHSTSAPTAGPVAFGECFRAVA